MEDATGSKTRTGSLCWEWGWQAIQKAGASAGDFNDLQFDKEDLVMTILEEVSAKGLAAVCGYQCGAKEAAVDDADALPRDRNGDRGFFPLPSTSSALMNRQ